MEGRDNGFSARVSECERMKIEYKFLENDFSRDGIFKTLK